MNRSGLKRTRERRDGISSNNERDLRDASVDSSQTAGTPHNYDLRSKRMKKEVIGESSDVCSKASTEENDESKETCGGIAGCKPVFKKVQKKSGDHVINKDVLKVYEAIVKSFVKKVFPGQNFVIMKGQLRQTSVVNQINQPIPDKNAVDFIVNQMTVFFDGPREDRNATTYGRRIDELREAIAVYMEGLYNQLSADDTDAPVPNIERNYVDENVDEFIEGDYFVDGDALKEWLTQKGNTRKESDKAVKSVKEKVVDMFEKLNSKYAVQNDMVDNWVKELWSRSDSLLGVSVN